MNSRPLAPQVEPISGREPAGEILSRAKDLFGRGMELLVGTARFELATPCTPSKCATRLRYVPMESAAEDDSVGFDFQILHQSAAPGEDLRSVHEQHPP